MVLRFLIIFIISPVIMANEKYEFTGENNSDCIVQGLSEDECTSPALRWAKSVDEFIKLQVLHFYPYDDKMCHETTSSERYERFNKAEREYKNFLRGYCSEIIPRQYGSGDNPHAYCMEEEILNRKKYLLEKLEGSFYVDYCSLIKGESNKAYLITNKFYVSIIKNCPDSFYLCNDVVYFGKRKSDGASIRLQGGYLIENNVHVGYKFEKGNLDYKVYFNGDLKVQKNSSVIFSDSGKWNYSCSDCES